MPYGFQSSFRHWAAEDMNHRREVIEAALARVVQNRVQAAYMRSDLFEQRIFTAGSPSRIIRCIGGLRQPTDGGEVDHQGATRLAILAAPR